MKYHLTILILIFPFIACKPVKRKPLPQKEGIVWLLTFFYNPDGTIHSIDTMTVWYKDSIAIEQVNEMRTNTIHNVTTITNSPLFFRYIDTRSNEQYDYLNFSDTAKAIRHSPFTDSFKDFEWNFYSSKIWQFKNIPQFLGDTLIGNVQYKKAKFNLVNDDANKTFLLGYFRTDGKGIVFSLEKPFCSRVGWTLTEVADFKIGKITPFAIIKVEFISDTLPTEALRVLTAWKKIAAQRPAGE